MEGDAAEGLSVRLGNLRAHGAVFGVQWELREQGCWSVPLAAERGLDGAATLVTTAGSGVSLSAKSFGHVSPSPGTSKGELWDWELGSLWTGVCLSFKGNLPES